MCTSHLPSVKHMYYMDVDFTVTSLDVMISPSMKNVMIGRIDQQIKVNKIMIDEFDLWKIPNPKAASLYV